MIYPVKVRYKDSIIELIGQVQERLPTNLKNVFMINNLSALTAVSQSKLISHRWLYTLSIGLVDTVSSIKLSGTDPYSQVT